MIAATDTLEARTDAFLAGQDGGRVSVAERGAITFSLLAVQSDQAERSFAAHEVFADLCHDLIGPDARLYHDQTVYKKPEKPRRLPWHQDNGYTFVMSQQYLTCWVALTDAIRKAYIFQYAPDGTTVLQGDPTQGPPTTQTPADDSGRQFPVLVAGEPVTPDPLS